MENLKTLDWTTILNKLSDLATSNKAKEALSHLAPLKSEAQANTSFDQIDELKPVLEQGQRPYMESLDLFPGWQQRLKKSAILKTIELKDVRHFCIETIALTEVLQPFESPWIEMNKELLIDAEEPLSAIDQIMTPDGMIRPDASETLHNLMREKDNLVQSIQKTLDRLVKDFEMETLLQDRYVTNREGRWVLPIKSGMQGKFDGIIHAASQSKQTVFMEPQEIIPNNNRLREIEVEIEQEIQRLLQQLSIYLEQQLPQLEQTYDTLYELDLVMAKTSLALQLEANRCKFHKSEIKLEQLVHPVLKLSTPAVIPNSVEMNKEKRILILSGPNAGGKTVLLKSIGLAAQMARCGLLICANEESHLPFFNKMYVGVGDSQSVDENLSTFAAHLKTLDASTQATGYDNLILIDEICGSTDPEEGAALARSFIHQYTNNETFAIITSHLGALKIGWEKNSGVINGSLEFHAESGPTYQFFMGTPGNSLAIQTAKRVGVDPKIIEKALDFLSPEMKNYQKNLEEIDEIKHELIETRKELKSEKKKFEKEKQKYSQLIANFEKEKNVKMDRSLKEAEQKVDSMIKNVKIDDIFKKHEALHQIKRDLPKVIKPTSLKDRNAQPTTKEEFEKRFPTGSKVFAESINNDAIIQGKPNGKGIVPVLSNSMRLMVHWSSLRPSRTQSNPTKNILRGHPTASFSHVDRDRVIDLRGKTSEEALEELEMQLDSAALAMEDRMKIIHGHGTDTLKRAVRSYLTRSVYVKKWNAGTKHNGGDGVTWVELSY